MYPSRHKYDTEISPGTLTVDSSGGAAGAPYLDVFSGFMSGSCPWCANRVGQPVRAALTQYRKVIM